MKYFIYFFSLFFHLSIFAQLDGSNQEKIKGAIPATINIEPNTKPTAPQQIGFDNKDGFKKAFQNETNTEEDLKYKGIITKEMLAEESYNKNFKKINGQYPVIDQNLGSFRSDGKFVTVYCRDFQYPDNDKVTIYHNDTPVVYSVVLGQSFQSFKIPLKVGLNTIAFKALNQGTSGPNTAAFKIYDDAGNLISANQWELATGAKATIAIAKTK